MDGLTQIFPENPTIVIDGKEYELEYTMQSLRELEAIYGSEENYVAVAQKMLQGVKNEDTISFLYAGLLHIPAFEENGFIIKTKWPWTFANREGARSWLAAKLLPKQAKLYAVAIFQAYVNASLTPEMLEMFQIIHATTADDQKKTASEPSGLNSTVSQ